MYVCVYIHTNIYVYFYVCMYIYIHIHTDVTTINKKKGKFEREPGGLNGRVLREEREEGNNVIITLKLKEKW